MQTFVSRFRMRSVHSVSFSALVMVLGVVSWLTGQDAMAQGVVISQVFGGNSPTAPFNQDYVELFNQTAAPVDLSGWSVQYAAAAGVSYQVGTISSGTIQPGGYFLVGMASSTGGTSLPAPDSTNTI